MRFLKYDLQLAFLVLIFMLAGRLATWYPQVAFETGCVAGVLAAIIVYNMRTLPVARDDSRD